MTAILAVLFTLAQLLDVATYRPATEVNPLVLLLGEVAAPLAKAAMIAAVIVCAAAVWPPRVGRAVLVIGIAAGLAGAVSNGMLG